LSPDVRINEETPKRAWTPLLFVVLRWLAVVPSIAVGMVLGNLIGRFGGGGEPRFWVEGVAGVAAGFIGVLLPGYLAPSHKTIVRRVVGVVLLLLCGASLTVSIVQGRDPVHYVGVVATVVGICMGVFYDEKS
jgi:urea transporter